MKLQVTALLVSGALIGAVSDVLAHHSLAKFDTAHPMEIAGTVKEFRLTSPHAFLLLQVNGFGKPTVWNLEGQSPSALMREGWSSDSLKPGDELTLKIDPLRSGAPGGAWTAKDTRRADGAPIVVAR